MIDWMNEWKNEWNTNTLLCVIKSPVSSRIWYRWLISGKIFPTLGVEFHFFRNLLDPFLWRKHVHIYERMDGWVDGRMDDRMADGWMDGPMEGWMNLWWWSRCSITILYLPSLPSPPHPPKNVPHNSPFLSWSKMVHSSIEAVFRY